MKLPARADGRGVEIGISDILAWRDCAARAKAGRLRLSGEDMPESWSSSNVYGTAIHLCITMLDEGATEDEAIAAAFAEFKRWLDPGDCARLAEDIEKYLAGEMTGVRTLLNEGEISVPLFVHPIQGQVWFRARIDRLYQSLENPALLFHVDYKSSKWAKSQEEVDKDLQMWSYNMGIFEWFTDLYPEVDADTVRLAQTYDQLNFGAVPTHKGPKQRGAIRKWLIRAVTAMIDDEEEAPTFNPWCAYCSLLMDCPVVQFQLTDWATTRIAALAPREPKVKKDGTPSKVLDKPKLDPTRIAEYVELLPEVHRGRLVLEAFEEILKGTLKEMPSSDLEAMGKRKSERSKRSFPDEAKRRIIDEIGLATFLTLCDLSIAGVERFYGEDKDAAALVTQHAVRFGSHTVIEDVTW
jgi:hypothetical protein